MMFWHAWRLTAIGILNDCMEVWHNWRKYESEWRSMLRKVEINHIVNEVVVQDELCRIQ